MDKNKPADKTLEQKYQKKTPIEHILTRPDTYVGDIKVQEEPMDIFDDDLQKIIKKNIKYVPALYKIFDEIIVNAFDHTKNDPTCDTIKISIDKEKNEISVFNNGKGIDVEIHPQHKIYVPELIFGELLTSTNYDDNEERTTGGRNGYGAKLTNIFSTKFILETVDETRKRKFYQEFTNNMGSRTKPKVTDYKLKSYTQITFYPDLKKFGLSELSDDIVALFKKRAFDIAGLGEKLKVYYNDKKIESNNFKKYISLYYPDEDVNFDEQERWKIGVIYKPDNNFEQKSFVNGISTYKGGNHVDYIMKGLIKKIKEAIAKKNKDLKIKDELIKENLIIFIDCTIINPAFSSQTKEELKTKQTDFGSTYEMNDKVMAKVIKSGIVEQIIQMANLKNQVILKNTDGKKTNNIKGIPKLEDADWAGTKKSVQCRLILTEGDSAKGLAMAGRSAVQDGNCRYGVFPLKGKLLNVREATAKQLLENEEMINIKKILGLQHNKEYKTASDLRYGSVIILTDQDSVTGDTPLLLRKNNILDIKNIQDISTKWEKNIINNKDYGVSDYEIWTEKGWTKIKKVMKHKVNKNIFRVLTHTGCVDVTEDHSLLNKDATEISPKDIKVGNELLHSFPHFKEHKILIPNNLAELQVREIWTYASRLKIRYYQNIPKDKLIQQITEINNRYYHKFDKIDYNINEEEAYAMGLFFADGSCGTYYWDHTYKNKDRPQAYTTHRESIAWAIVNTNLDYLKKAKLKLEKIYKYEFKIIECALSKDASENSSICYKLIVNGGEKVREFVDRYRLLFYNDFETFSPTDKKVPIDILNNNHNIRQEFFDGYYDGDGSKTKDCKFFDVASKITSQGLYLLCKSLGYEVSINHNPKKPKVYVLTITKGTQQFNPDQIKKIIDLGQQEIEVYDLETENHHFQAGVGSMIVHNTDGYHIKGLVMNFFHHFFPSLIKLDFIHSLATPIVKASKGKDTKTFYNLTEYETWKNKIDTNAWHIKYYKGLGTSNREEAKEYFNDLENKLIKYTWADKSIYGDSSVSDDDEESVTSSKKSQRRGTKKSKTTSVDDVNKEHICYDAITLAFEKKRADDRKDWLMKYDKSKIIQNDVKEVPIYDFIHRELIHFSNDDINRSIPSVIDGLKPSQRKVQYGCVLRKLFKKQDEIKVAQLSGFVSDKTSYHHGEASLQGTIIGLGQTFVGSNNLNLLHPSGQFGCLSPDTPILMWNGTIKNAEHIVIGDILIGDDGNKRTVSQITNGIDDMYEIIDIQDKKMIVNSQHILTLSFNDNFVIKWKESCKRWYFNYFDGENIKQISVETNELDKSIIHHNKSKINKTEGYEIIIKKCKEIKEKYKTNEIIDIKLVDYKKLSNYDKRMLYMVSNFNCINWEKKNVPIDPYIFGTWLGDGDSAGKGFTSCDEEIIKKYVMWADTINAEITHHKVTNHDGYHYTIRRKGSGSLSAIGRLEHSCSTCEGCISSDIQLKHNVCDWNYKGFKDVYKEPNKNLNIENLNPFTQLLKNNNLLKNKHIPIEYIINDKQTRLQLLAGFIDTDGTCKSNNTPSAYFEISQSERLHKNLIESLEYICKSLGYATSIYESQCDQLTKKGESKKMLTLRIFGNNLDEIPTILKRKQIKYEGNREKKTMHLTKFKINYVGKNKFCGWSIDKNERFLLGNFVVTHNSRLLGGKDAASARYIFTYLAEWNRLIFRPEDEPILTYLNDDGTPIEPEYYVPIIPMVLVNGAQGIGTGFSTTILQYNPLQIIDNIFLMMDNKSVKEMYPWYRGFKGKVEKADNGFNLKGIYKVEKDTSKVIISELPVGTWTTVYKEYLDKLEEDKIIKGYRDKNTDESVYFEIQFTDDNLFDLIEKKKLESVLKIVNKETITNMHSFNKRSVIKKYETIYDILREFYDVRLEYYKKRKQHQIDELNKELDVLEWKMKFIRGVIDNKIIVNNQTKDKIVEQLVKLEFPKLSENKSYDYLLHMPIYSLSKEKIDELQKKIDELEEELAKIEAMSEIARWKLELGELKKCIEKIFKE